MDYLHLIPQPKPNTYDPDHATTVRAVFAVAYAREALDNARAALEALPAEFEREREHEQHEIEVIRRRMATCAAWEKAILEKRLKKHTEALTRMNLTLRMRWARESVASAEARLQATIATTERRAA